MRLESTTKSFYTNLRKKPIIVSSQFKFDSESDLKVIRGWNSVWDSYICSDKYFPSQGVDQASVYSFFSSRGAKNQWIGVMNLTSYKHGWKLKSTSADARWWYLYPHFLVQGSVISSQIGCHLHPSVLE